MKEYILVFDIGTTSLKTALYDRNFNTVALAQRTYPTDYPKPDWAEQDPGNWWKAMVESVAEILAGERISPEDIKVIGLDAMTPVLVPVNSRGDVLRPAIIWMDRRASEQCRKIDQALGERLFEINGNHNDPSNLAPKIMWVRDMEPQIYEQSHKFLYASSYLVYLMTGKMLMDKTQSGLSQLCDTRTGDWSLELIEGCGLDREKLPDIVEPASIAGTLTREAAEKLGLSVKTKVIAGAMDNAAAGLGLGIYNEGQVFISAGTATNGCFCSSTPVYDKSLHVYRHIVPDRWLSAAGVDYGGAGLKWFRDLMGNMSFEELVDRAEKKSGHLSSLVFLPYMVGQRAPLWNTATRGVIFGLDPSVDHGDLANMFMVGNAMGIKNIFSIVESLGLPVEEVKLTGGCSRSSYYSQIFSNVTGKNVRIAGESDVATLGMAMASAFAMGWYSDFSEMTDLIEDRTVFRPESKETDFYNDLYILFKDLYGQLENQYEKLNQIREKYSNKEVLIK